MVKQHIDSRAAGYAGYGGNVHSSYEGSGCQSSRSERGPGTQLQPLQQSSELSQAHQEYKKWMGKAADCAGVGNVNYMEAYITKARWTIEDAGIPGEARTTLMKDLSKYAGDVRWSGYRNAAFDNEVDSIANAFGGYRISMESNLEKFRAHSLKAGLEPDGKVGKIRAIFAEQHGGE